MNQAYEFFEALASGNLTRILFILFVQILAIIIIGSRHEEWRWLINRRVLFRIILSLLISVVTTLLFKRSLIFSLLGYSSAAVVAVIGLIFSENVIFPENLLLRLTKRKYEALDFNEGQNLPDKKIFFGLSVPFKIEYLHILASYLLDNDDLHGAYRVYKRIESFSLFDSERTRLNIIKAQLFCLAGNIKGAELILSKMDISHYPELKTSFLISSSLLAESKGNLEEASDLLSEALKENEDKAGTVVINNLGRLKYMRGNDLEAMRYYEKALFSAGDKVKKRSKSIAFQNLIDLYVRNGELEKASRTFEKFKTEFSNGGIYDKARFFSYQMVYGRQIGNRSLILDSIAAILIDVIPSLPKKSQLIMLVSTLKAVYDLSPITPMLTINSLTVTMPDVHDNLTQLLTLLYAVRQKWEEISMLPFEKLFELNKELFYILTRLADSNLIEPFRQIYGELCSFFRDSIDSIDRKVLSLGEPFVYERWQWENNRLFAARFFQKEMNQAEWPGYLTKVVDHMEDLIQELDDNDAVLLSVEAKLNLVDEVLATIDHQRGSSIQNKLIEKSRKYLAEADRQITEIGNHVSFCSSYIRIAFYAMTLGECSLCSKYYNSFLATGIAVQQFSQWIRQYFAEVERYILSCNDNSGN
ncbi:tetratricopeptide repeat protein [Mesotoga sp. UBA5847]|jgi:tetratricopeptide (TPR) repeat protein|uniref:tetratricopeptide repeat protein n=1 Tax=Mesotoga sp. UBA5847 TaxID=1946859 RepID=UPI001BD3DDC0|nr:tetratricopeptide repeat protein [Mesotoga sp. UBA5847]